MAPSQSNSQTRSQSNLLVRAVGKLASIEIGSSRRRSPGSIRIPRKDLTFILRNLATLLDNGLPLPRSLATLSQERAVRRYEPVLDDLRRSVETGEPISSAMARYPDSFNEIIVNQVRAGERAGTLVESLLRLSAQLQRFDETRSLVIRKLSYPAVLVGAGTVAVSFMILFVIPVFQQTYDEAGIPLPMITRVLIGAGEIAVSYGWVVLVVAAGAYWAYRRAAADPKASLWLDQIALRVPVFGELLRNIVVLHFMEVFGNLLESGFTVVDALEISARVVKNRAIRGSIDHLRSAVNRGERFSRELDKLGELFPPVVSQLVMIGEQSGQLVKTSGDIRRHLHRDIEDRTNALVGTIEPILTITLAAMIGVILLAIYLPMFDMMGTASVG